MKPPTDSQIAATVRDFDRLGTPVDATIAEILDAMRTAGLRGGTDRARLAQRTRQARDGITTRKARPAHQYPRAFALIAALVDGRLLGAACVGQHALFDDRHDGEPAHERDARHRAAVAICADCTVVDNCEHVYRENTGKVAGVWAGHTRTHTRRSTP
ncbi:MAG: hypothetical protein GX610_22975 [Rhodococcus sp.]|nr:hypothetical protein [Rhodococcus sp. (in: high G+C Gram-positive bacteria)]